MHKLSSSDPRRKQGPLTLIADTGDTGDTAGGTVTHWSRVRTGAGAIWYFVPSTLERTVRRFCCAVMGWRGLDRVGAG